LNKQEEKADRAVQQQATTVDHRLYRKEAFDDKGECECPKKGGDLDYQALQDVMKHLFLSPLGYVPLANISTSNHMAKRVESSW
jgi:hypothetical protein